MSPKTDCVVAQYARGRNQHPSPTSVVAAAFSDEEYGNQISSSEAHSALACCARSICLSNSTVTYQVDELKLVCCMTFLSKSIIRGTEIVISNQRYMHEKGF